MAKFLKRDLRQLHVAAQSVNPKLSPLDKTPYCGNGGIYLPRWELVELEDVHPSEVCGVCLRRLEANGVDIGLIEEGI